MSSGRKRIPVLLALAVVIFLSGIFTIHTDAGSGQAEKRILKVGFPELDGFSTVDEDGVHRGLVVDYLNEISKYTGWEYEYVQGDVSELLNMLVAGELDIMGGMYYDEWMDDLYEFPDYNMGYNYGILFGRADDTSMNAYDIESIQGKTIGVFEKATAKIERLKKYTWIIILYPATLFTMEKRI